MCVPVEGSRDRHAAVDVMASGVLEQGRPRQPHHAQASHQGTSTNVDAVADPQQGGVLGGDVEQLGAGGPDELPPARGRRRVDGAHLGGQGDRSPGDLRAWVRAASDLGEDPVRGGQVAEPRREADGRDRPDRGPVPTHDLGGREVEHRCHVRQVGAVVAGGKRVEPGGLGGGLDVPEFRRASRAPSTRVGGVPPSGPPSRDRASWASRGSGRSDGRSKATSTLARPGTTVAWGHRRRARAATRSTHWGRHGRRITGSTSSARSPNARIATGSPTVPRCARPRLSRSLADPTLGCRASLGHRAWARAASRGATTCQPCASSASRIARAAATAPGVSPWTHSESTATAIRGPSIGVT